MLPRQAYQTLELFLGRSTKVRIADVLPIEKSGIAPSEYRFALQSHFDFVVADNSHIPLFAVEFDGPSHKSPVQRVRDDLKEALCRRFRLQVLRVNARYIPKIYRGMNLLTWFVEVWFLQRAFYEEQADGNIAPDEVFDPFAVVSMSGHKGAFPLWLSLLIQNEIAKMHCSGRCVDPAPSHLIARDEQGSYRALAWLMLDAASGILAAVRMRNHLFPIRAVDALEQVVLFELHHRLRAVQGHQGQPSARHVMESAVRSFKRKYGLCEGAWTGELHKVVESVRQ
jgi:hypothetical protein